MATDDTTSGELRQTKATLKRLAQALDCPTEVFSGLVSHQIQEANELLTLWLAIENPEGRATIMSVLRAEADRTATLDGDNIRLSSAPLSLVHATQKPDKTS